MHFLKIGSLMIGFFLSSIAVAQDDSVVPATVSTTATAVASVLDDFHLAAAAGDWQKYFSLMSDDGVFLGSDISERWPKAEFQSYATPS